MSVLKKVVKNAAKEAGIISGNGTSKNAQNATNEAVNGMKYFKAKIESPYVQNGSFSTTKGNLFEYIIAARYNVAAASEGVGARAYVTDITDPHSPADILINKNGKTVQEIQAKFSNSKHVAADTVFMQSNPKYRGMTRLGRYGFEIENGKKISYLDKEKELAKKASERTGNLRQGDYKDVYDNLTDEIDYDGVSSGGITLEEIEKAYKSPENYANQFEKNCVKVEMKTSAVNMARASILTTGIVSGISNFAEVYSGEKSIESALHDIGVDSIKGGVRGAATGVVSTAIRYKSIKAGNVLLSDSAAATVMAGGVIDCGVSLYSYALGEIDEEELKNQVVDTTARATTTIFFTKAVTEVMGKTVSPIVPMAVYTTANYIFTATREIIKNANLNAEEYNRMAAILCESKRQMDEYNQKLHAEFERIDATEKQRMEKFFQTFKYNMETGESYDQAIDAIVELADQAGIFLKYASLNDFSTAMTNKDTFRLG